VLHDTCKGEIDCEGLKGGHGGWSCRPLVAGQWRSPVLWIALTNPCDSTMQESAFLLTSVLVLALGMVFASKGLRPNSVGYAILNLVAAVVIVCSTATFTVLLVFEVRNVPTQGAHCHPTCDPSSPTPTHPHPTCACVLVCLCACVLVCLCACVLVCFACGTIS
jgi:hypothetical protein